MADVVFGSKGQPVLDDSVEVVIGGIGKVNNSPNVYYPGSFGQPVLDDTVEVMNEGFYIKTNSDVIYGAVGTPVYDGTISVINEGPVLDNYDNKGKNVFLGAIGTPVFDDSLEVQNEGMLLLDFDNKGKNVFITGEKGTPVFADDDTSFPPRVGTPPDNKDITVVLSLSKGNIFDDEVVFYKPPLNFSP